MWYNIILIIFTFNTVDTSKNLCEEIFRPLTGLPAFVEATLDSNKNIHAVWVGYIEGEPLSRNMRRSSLFYTKISKEGTVVELNKFLSLYEGEKRFITCNKSGDIFVLRMEGHEGMRLMKLNQNARILFDKYFENWQIHPLVFLDRDNVLYIIGTKLRWHKPTEPNFFLSTLDEDGNIRLMEKPFFTDSSLVASYPREAVSAAFTSEGNILICSRYPDLNLYYKTLGRVRAFWSQEKFFYFLIDKEGNEIMAPKSASFRATTFHKIEDINMYPALNQLDDGKICFSICGADTEPNLSYNLYQVLLSSDGKEIISNGVKNSEIPKPIAEIPNNSWEIGIYTYFNDPYYGKQTTNYFIYGFDVNKDFYCSKFSSDWDFYGQTKSKFW